MMDNERRADLGQQAVLGVATETNVAKVEEGQTAVIDVLAYVAHFCDRLDLDPRAIFASALESYEGDFEDGPAAKATLDAAVPLAESTQFNGSPI
jgi:hypothetical protein